MDRGKVLFELGGWNALSDRCVDTHERFSTAEPDETIYLLKVCDPLPEIRVSVIGEDKTTKELPERGVYLKAAQSDCACR